MNPFSFERPAAQAGQIGLGAGLVQKDQPSRVKPCLPTPPQAARPGDVRTVLFAGAECLFLYVRPNFLQGVMNRRQIVLTFNDNALTSP